MRPDEFPGELSFHRGRNGLTQKQLAEKLNVSDRSVKMWEAGESVPRKGVRIQMAQVLGLPSIYFLQEEEIPSSAAPQKTTSAEHQLRLLRNKFADYLADSDIPDELKLTLSGAIDNAIEKANMTDR